MSARLLQPVPPSGIPGIVGESRAMREVFALVRTAAASDITVLIEGETGTGKELVARALATLGARRERPFVAINCGAVPESMLDAELFGHRRGAFTGADGDRRGLLESAHGGTVFLDEITSMTASFQARLLRVLENAEIRAVGCDRVRRVDLRFVAASNRRLEEAVHRGQFRADLFYRLSVFSIALPPLRERRDDIPLLIDAFLAAARCADGVSVTEVTAEALERLVRYDYPGNVRQLRNEIVRAAALAAGCERIAFAHLSPRLRGVSASGVPALWSERSTSSTPGTVCTDGSGSLDQLRSDALADVERHMIREALERQGYNLSRAAVALGVSRFGLRKRMRRLGLSVRRSLAVPSAPGAPGESVAVSGPSGFVAASGPGACLREAG
jgi:two-component system response regulator HupR/HoxA